MPGGAGRLQIWSPSVPPCPEGIAAHALGDARRFPGIGRGWPIGRPCVSWWPFLHPISRMRSSARHAQPALDPATTPPEMTDAEAVREVVDGNREMFEVIVRRYNQRLYRIGMGYLQDHAETEDAMQNAYVKAFLHLGRFRGNAAFATWLTRIMINECLMVLRSRKRPAIESLDDEDSPPGEPSCPRPSGHAARPRATRRARTRGARAAAHPSDRVTAV